MNSYVCIDLETTGLSPKHDKIIEIGAVKVVNGEISDTYSTFVNPGRKLDERIIELTHITEQNLESAPEIKDVISKVISFTDNLPLLGHRIIFDFSFLKQAAVNAGLSFDKEGIDTLKLARICFPELPSKRLTDMCDYYGIKLDAHRALNDAMATVELFKRLSQDFEEKYPDKFNETKLIYNVKKETPIRASQIEKITALVERYNIACPYEIEKMSRNEASRYYDVIRAQYGIK